MFRMILNNYIATTLSIKMDGRRSVVFKYDESTNNQTMV
jgi:hypothetical protein